MLWNAATHGLSIPRDGGAQAAGTAKRRAHQAAVTAKRHGVRLPRRPRGSSPETPGFSGAPEAPLCVSPTG